MKFNLSARHEGLEYGNNFGLQMEFEAEMLDDIVQHLDQFIKASGFIPKGNLEYVETVDENDDYQ